MNQLRLQVFFRRLAQTAQKAHLLRLMLGILAESAAMCEDAMRVIRSTEPRVTQVHFLKLD